MATELPRPGVEVIQVVRSVTPTVVTPTLVPCVVGVCKQIVDVLEAGASGSSQINPSSLVSLPALLVAKAATGTPAAYGGLNAKSLVLSVNHGPDIDIEFLGSSLSAASVVQQIQDVFAELEVSEALVEAVGTTGFRIKSAGVGEFQSIEVRPGTDPEALTAFGLVVGYTFTGSTAYDGDYLELPPASFPDPRGNLAELSIEPDTVRVFLGMGSGANLREVSRTTSFLRKGGTGTGASQTGTVALVTAGLYGGAGSIGTKTLIVSIDGAPQQTVTFATPADQADLLQQVNNQLGGSYGSAATGLKLASRSSGTASSVEIVGGTALSALGFTAGKTTGGSGVKIVDDGNGDAVSPLVEVPGANFGSAASAAVATGTVDLSTLTYPTDLQGKTLKLGMMGHEPQVLTFGAVANAAAVLTAINGFWTGLLAATQNGSNQLVLTASGTGEESSIEIYGGTATGPLGLAPAIVGSNAITNLRPDATVLNGKKLRLDLNGTIIETTFTGLTSGSAATAIAAQVQSAIAAVGVADVSGGALRVRLKDVTDGAYIRVMAASSADAAFLFGFDTNQRGTLSRVEGSGFAPQSGDDLYVDGVLVGRITQVSPGTNSARLRIDKQLPINASFGSRFHIVAKNLATDGAGGTRPLPELTVGLDGTPRLKQDLLRDTVGNVVQGKAPVYVSYRAIRQDVTARAKRPGLLRVDNTTELTDIASPVNTSNPFALGLYFALLNAPGAQVSGLGVDEVSADSPYGTVEAFTRAAEFLEAYEVYAIAPLTHDETVAQVFNTHVTAMSQPASKGERVVLFNLDTPTKKVDTLVASGLNGNSIGSSGTQFDTGVVNLPGLVLSAGISPVGTVPTSAGLFLDVASSSARYSIQSIAGGVVTIRSSFAAGENDDAFYSTHDLNDPPMPSVLIDEAFAIRVRGDSLTRADGSPDKQAMAETYQAIGQTFLNRRFWNVMPAKAAATIGGLEQEVEGFYMCAAIAGMIGQQPPQQSFTNFPMTGFTKAIGSNDFFSDKQLNVIAAGGNYIVVQDAEGAPLTSRMALTTDMTSIETRTDSITKIVDFCAKFMRKGLKNFIGRFNITQGFLDSLGHIVQGLLGFLADIGVLIGSNMNNIVQDENAPDTVLIDITLDVPYPCNYIRLTLVI